MSQEEIKKEGMGDPTTKLKVKFAASGELPDEGMIEEVKGISFFKDEDSDSKVKNTV
jgi:hypothetical protein